MAVIALNLHLLQVVIFLMVINMLLSAYRLRLIHVSINFFIFQVTYMPCKKKNMRKHCRKYFQVKFSIQKYEHSSNLVSHAENKLCSILPWFSICAVESMKAVSPKLSHGLWPVSFIFFALDSIGLACLEQEKQHQLCCNWGLSSSQIN